DRPRPESGDLSGGRRDREEDAIPEPVVVPGPVPAPDDESGLLHDLSGQELGQRVQESVPTLGRPAHLEARDPRLFESPRGEIGARLGCARMSRAARRARCAQSETGVEEVAGKRVRLVDLLEDLVPGTPLLLRP